MNSSFYLVVSGLEDIKALEEGNVSVYGVNGSYEKWYYNFDLSCGDEEQIQIQNEIDKKINALAEQESEESDTLFLELLQTAEPHQGLITRLCTAVCSSLESFLESYSFLEWC